MTGDRRKIFSTDLFFCEIVKRKNNKWNDDGAKRVMKKKVKEAQFEIN